MARSASTEVEVPRWRPSGATSRWPAASSRARASGRNLAKPRKTGWSGGAVPRDPVSSWGPPSAGPGAKGRYGDKGLLLLAFLPRSCVKEERYKGLDVVGRGQQDSFGWGTMSLSFFRESQQA